MFLEALNYLNQNIEELLKQFNLVQKDEDGDEIEFADLKELHDHDDSVAQELWENVAREKTGGLESMVNAEEAVKGVTHEGIALGDIINEMVYMSFINGQFKQFKQQLGEYIDEVPDFTAYVRDKHKGKEIIGYIADNYSA